MAQIHQYGNPFVSLNPPEEWPESGIDSTLNDSLLESNATSNFFTFSGKAGVAILKWKADFGVHNGMPYRQTYFDGINTTVAFNGYLKLTELEYDSESEPVKLRCPIVELADPKTVLDEIAVMTQGVLIKNGFLNHLDYIDVPFIIESKKNIKERALIITQFGIDVAVGMSQIVSNILGAVANLLGLGIVVGVIELAVVFLNAWLVIKGLIAQWNKIRDLFFPTIRYYKAISFKKLLTKAFLSKGYSLDLGIRDQWMSDTYILASQNENFGLPFQNMPFTGELKRSDYGYIISEILDGLNTMTNLRTKIDSSFTVHVKTRSDPSWYTAPVYTPENVLIKTVKQYSNGIYSDDTENCKGTVMINYQYDLSDAHTLTEKNGDSHEVRRKLIVEQNTKMNLLKGIDNLEIPWAMCVRKKTFDNIWDLFNGVTGDFNNLLQQAKDKINQFITDIQNTSPGAAVIDNINNILNQTGLNAILTHRDGVLKVEDDSWAIPKVLYLKQVTVAGIGLTYRIPADFKDFIGGKALYTDNYFPFSPADINNFLGQYRKVDNLKLKWSQKKFIQTQTNPNFILDGKHTQFTFVNWTENNHSAQANLKIQDTFDKNITEIEI